LDGDNEDEAENPQIQPNFASKETRLTLETYIKGNECIEDLFKPLDYLENIIENNVFNKQKH